MGKKTIGKRGNFKKKAAAITLAGFLGAASPAYALPVNSEPAPEKNKSKVSIILGARKGLGSNGLQGVELGGKYKDFALVGNICSGSDINLQDTEENVFGNVYFQGREDLEKRKSFGGSLEYHPRLGKGVSLVFGAGIGLESRIRNINENLIREGTVLASNQVSKKENGVFGEIYFGPSIKATKWLEINPNIGYKTGKEKGMVANIRAILSFSGKKGDR